MRKFIALVHRHRWLSAGVALLLAAKVQAVSLGEPQVESYIGQPLKTFVPILGVQGDAKSVSVAAPTAAQIEQFGAGGQNVTGLNYQTAYAGNRLGVLITSNKPILEPYVNVFVQLNDNGQILVRQFSILLDPSPGTQTSALVTTPPLLTERITPSNNNATTGGSVVTGPAPDIMGPYDWAQQGAVAKQFGPVLDGQSLWRVARRINKALDVSIDQMMWALYRANPDAFATSSPQSLRAGSVLDIPQRSFIVEATEMQAVRELQAANNGGVAVAGASNDVDNSGTEVLGQGPELTTTQSDLTDEKVADDETESPASEGESQEFTVAQTGTDEANRDIIDTLNSTVAELTEQLVIKDQRIAFLEDQIEQLTGAQIGEESAEGGLITLTTEGQPVTPLMADTQTEFANDSDEANEPPELTLSDEQTSGLAADPSDGGVGSEDTGAEGVDQSASTDEPATTADTSSETDAPGVSIATASSELNPDDGLKPWWLTWPVLFALVALALIILTTLVLLTNLQGKIARFFRRDKSMVLNIPSVVDNNSDVNIRTQVASRDTLLDHDDDYFDDVGDYLVEEHSGFDITESDFSDRMNDLINNGEIEQAREIISKVEAGKVDADELDICLLKVTAAEKDKAEFAKVFNRVNRHINDFHPDLQYQIAKLHRQMFDTEDVIDFGFNEYER